jgi:glycosyltransferase involved in cell wall biosynthesis
MKIAVFDPWGYKFSQPIIDHWKSLGHEVRSTIYTDPEYIRWSDVTYFEVIDNNILSWLREWPDAKPAKKVIVRGVDIDLWVRNPRKVDWSRVDDLILLNEHSKDIMRGYMELPNIPIHVIPCGVDVDYWYFKNKKKAYNLGWIGDMWVGKNPAKAIEILYELVKRDPGNPWNITFVGNLDRLRSGDPWWVKHMYHLAEHFGLVDRIVFHQQRIEDLNEFYNTLDYLIVTSFKEQFSYVSGEAMSKGIRPVIHHFWGADKIWPDKYLYLTTNEAADQILSEDYNRKEYRDFIVNKYPMSKMLEQYDKIIND